MFRHVAVALVMLCGSAQAALAQQTLNFTFGYFTVRGEDARVAHDILVADRDFLTYEVSDFNGPTVGGEWLFPIGNFLEGGAGVSFSRRTVPSIYTDFQASDNTEIEQALRLRIVPVAFTFRVLPLGHSSPVQPYFGAGIGIFSWRYSETGDFIDFSTSSRVIRPGSFVESGSDTGPVALAGIRFAGDALSVGGEVRYQKAEGDLNDDFYESKIDLGGWSYQATVGIRFGR